MNASHWTIAWCNAVGERVKAMTDKFISEITCRREKGRSVNCENSC